MKLASEVQQLLHKNDLHANERPTDAGAYLIYDCDGEHLFDISPQMSADDLWSMLRYAARSYQSGIQRGREEIRSGIRTLLDVAPMDHVHAQRDITEGRY